MSPREALLTWYDRCKRDLPWRRGADAYAVWLSEVMLQQTRVETVLPYFEKFLERFPTVELLALAPEEEVLSLWSGLGYYRRARQLHAAAQRIASRGAFPRTVEELRELPGIGKYTASAVASIAFGVASPVLDGNVERVLSRFLALEGNPKAAGTRDVLRRAASEFLAAERPGDSNQALMELGATVCVPRNPRCPQCPIERGCLASREGFPERYPSGRVKREMVVQKVLAVVTVERERVLLFRRSDEVPLLAGTWELPWVELPGESALDIGWAAEALGLKYGGIWDLREEIGEVRHGITYRDLRVAAWRGSVRGGGEVREGPEAGWFSEVERRSLPLSSLVGKILAVVSLAPRARRSRSRQQ